MKLEKKKALAARTLGVGKGRIMFNTQRLSEVKEAITKQDIIDLHNQGAIIIKEVKGRKKVRPSKSRRRQGSVRKKISKGKTPYVTITRKLRAYLKTQLEKGSLTKEQYWKLRKEIKTHTYKTLPRFKERITQMREEK